MMSRTVLRSVAVTGAFSLLCSNASAACQPVACDNEYIEQLRISENGDVYITTSGDEALLNCPLYADAYITLPASAQGSDKIYAALLSVKNQNQRMGRIRIVEGSSGCRVSYVW